MPRTGTPRSKIPAWRMGRALLVDALRAAGQDERLRAHLFQALDGGIEGEDLGINAQLADLAGDELGVLRPEIEDEDLVHGWILSDAPATTSGV